MFYKNYYKKLWCEEKEKKEKSRDYIQKTHDSVIRTEEKVKTLKEDNEKLDKRLTEHLNEEYDCPKKDAIDALVKAKAEQNGSIERMEKTMGEVLLVAQGKKLAFGFMGKIVGITVTSIVTGSGIVAGGYKLLQWLEWIS
jgi:predicted RNase H-like nuclease (RuvC/YqgF family)